jgi:uncharacterized protein YaaN involved in tellurite resistance
VTGLDKRRRAEIAGQAMKWVAELVTLAPLSPAFDHKIEELAVLGRDAMAQLAARQSAGLAHVAPPPLDGIGQAIAGLRSLAASLEPLREGGLAETPRRWGLRLRRQADPRRYFARFRDSQGAIAAALAALVREGDGLLRANVGIEAEAASLAPLLTALAEAAFFAEQAALTLAARADQLAVGDPVKAQRLRSAALPAVEARGRDLAEARALAQQAIMARRVVGETNARLIAGIDQARATMLLVLRTAMTAARLIAQQDLVLEGIAGLAEAAGNRIADDPATAPERAEALQAAFTKLYDALDRLALEREVSAARLAAPPA